MKEMIRARNDHYREPLRACPVEDRGKRHGVVEFAMQHERIDRHIEHAWADDRSANEDEPVRGRARLRQPLGHAREHQRAK